MSTSERKSKANRRNAQKSTGPKTARGKNLVRLNAVKTGIYAAAQILPSEDHQQHQRLIEQLREELQPQGLMEEFLFAQIARAFLKIERVSRGYDVLISGLVYRQAVVRRRRDEIRAAGSYVPAITKIENEIDELLDLCPTQRTEPGDLDQVLKNTISNESDVNTALHVDRRTRALLHDISNMLSQLRGLQAHRHASAVIPPPRSGSPNNDPADQLPQIGQHDSIPLPPDEDEGIGPNDEASEEQINSSAIVRLFKQ